MFRHDGENQTQNCCFLFAVTYQATGLILTSAIWQMAVDLLLLSLSLY